MDENIETRNLVLSVCDMKQHGEVPPACCATQCVILGVRLYLFGGADEMQSYGTLHMFEIAREHWTTIQTKGLSRPSPRYGHTLSLWKDRLILFAGMEQTEFETQRSTVNSYSPPPCVLNQTNEDKQSSQKRLWHHRGTPSNSLYLFDTVTSEWIMPTVSGKTPEPRSFHSASLIDYDSAKLFIWGGCSTSFFDKSLQDGHLLDLETWTWYSIDSQTGTVPTARFGHQIAYVPKTRKLYLFGGNPENEDSETLYCGDLNDDVRGPLSSTSSSSSPSAVSLHWEPTSCLGTTPMPRRFHAMSLVNQYLYIVSGLTAAASFSDIYVFDLSAKRWSKPLYETELNFSAAGFALLVDKLLVFGGVRFGSARSAALNALKEFANTNTGTSVQLKGLDSKLSRHLCFLSVLQIKNMMSGSYRFKLVAVGDSGVGKSCLLQRFTQNVYNDHSVSTVGVDFLSVPAMVQGKLVTMQLWDTAGQERYSGITGNYYRNADGFVIVYDATSKASFEHVLSWMQHIKDTHDFGESTIKLLIGNKQDLIDQIVVSDVEAKGLADTIGAIYLGTSAKTGAGVDTAFLMAAKRLLDVKRPREKSKESLESRITLESISSSDNLFSRALKCCSGGGGGG